MSTATVYEETTPNGSKIKSEPLLKPSPNQTTQTASEARVEALATNSQLIWGGPTEGKLETSMYKMWNTACKRYTIARVEGGPDPRFVVLATLNGVERIIVNDLKNLKAALERAELYHCVAFKQESAKLTSNKKQILDEAIALGIDKRVPKAVVVDKKKPITQEEEIVVMEITREGAIDLLKNLGSQLDFTNISSDRIAAKLDALKAGIEEYVVPPDPELVELRDKIVQELQNGNDVNVVDPNNEKSDIKVSKKKVAAKKQPATAETKTGPGKDRFGCMNGKVPAQINACLADDRPVPAEEIAQKTGLTAKYVNWNLKWYANNWGYCKETEKGWELTGKNRDKVSS